jgi:hydrogenase maturation protein HypF
MKSSESLHWEGRHYQVSGIVQGVGFRPYVYKLATKFGLTGDVRNTTEGVEINLYGTDGQQTEFETVLRTSPPALSKVDRITICEIPFEEKKTFKIIESARKDGEYLPIPPDIAICDDCRREILDPANKRYHYAFNNCINCGPRFTIIKDLPYDRINTAMSGFRMCPDCQSEYEDPSNRRYHAQPTGCPVCGPELEFRQQSEPAVRGERALQAAAVAIRDGKIVAIKGLGGYHLACDALNRDAIRELRKRKLRSDKPFALMASDLSVIRKYAVCSDAEQAALRSERAPIVLLDRLPDSPIPPEVAPKQSTLGFMLPYTPLHVLLFDAIAPDTELLIMTSANISEEPIICDETDEDMRKLFALSDCILTHNRPIITRIDDSVIRFLPEEDRPILNRRARGYAPDPIRLAEAFPQILGVGGDLKNTFCLTRDRYAFLSQHIGDMENVETSASFEQNLDHFRHLFRIRPEAIACDLHPNYFTVRFAERYAEKERIPLLRIQHHYAHIASVLGEYGRFSAEPAIGLAFDGTGYGSDATIWGGEVLLCNARGFERLFHLQSFPLPGGDAAVRHPARQALALLHRLEIPWTADLPPVKALKEESVNALGVIDHQIRQRINCTETSAMGRLFDAVSALIGVCQKINYEGQAAIELESIASSLPDSGYEFPTEGDEIKLKPLIESVLWDFRHGISQEMISAKFHRGLIDLTVEICIKIRKKIGGNPPVAVSGGVWQNRILLEGVRNRLTAEGFELLIPHQVPLNDGCIAFGQVMIAKAILGEK